VGKYKRNI
jgi:hypothetical protein